MELERTPTSTVQQHPRADQTDRAARPLPGSRLLPLAVAAVTLQASYAGFFLWRYPLLPYYERPLLDLGKIGGYGLDALLATGQAFGLLFAAHALAWWGARRLATSAVGPILALSALFQLTLAFVYPVVAADVFNYLLQGRLLALHGLNPLTATPASAAADPWLRYSAFPQLQLAYGPVWVWLAALIAALTPANLLAALLGVKALAIAANLANSLLIYRIAARLRPAAALPALVFYAWSPLVLFETVANAHNDGVMATPLLLAIWLVVRGGRRALLAPAALTVAALVKYAPVILLPPVVLAAWQAARAGEPGSRGAGGMRPHPNLSQRKRGEAPWPARVPVSGGAPRPAPAPAERERAGGEGGAPAPPLPRSPAPLLLLGLALSGLLAALAYAPFWAGPATLAGVGRQAAETTTSLVAVLAASQAAGWSKETWVTVGRLAAGAILLLVMLWRRPATAAAAPAAAFDLLLAQLLVATFWFQPWYLVPLLGLAAASADRWRQTVGFVFGVSATASYLVYFYLWVTPWWGTLSQPQVQALAAAVVYLPPLLLLAGRLAQRGVRRAG